MRNICILMKRYNFRVIPHLPTELGVGISSFRQRGAFVKGKVQDVRLCQKNVWNQSESLFFSVRRNLCAMRVVNWTRQRRLWRCCERVWK
jgi:hypothetical protein